MAMDFRFTKWNRCRVIGHEQYLEGTVHVNSNMNSDMNSDMNST